MAQKGRAMPSNKIISEAQIDAVIEPPQVKLVQGFEWSQLRNVDERLEGCMWNSGVMELSDLDNKPHQVIAALQLYYNTHLGTLREAAKEYRDVISR